MAKILVRLNSLDILLLAFSIVSIKHDRDIGKGTVVGLVVNGERMSYNGSRYLVEETGV